MPLLRRTLDGFKYKPGSTFVLAEMSNYIKTQVVVNMGFRVLDSDGSGKKVTIMSNVAIDLRSIENAPTEGLAVEYFLEKLRDGIRSFELHEADEWIKWRGNQVFDPHRGEGDGA